MGRRVVQPLDGVVPPPHDHAVFDHDGADGHLALLERALRLLQRDNLPTADDTGRFSIN